MAYNKKEFECFLKNTKLHDICIFFMGVDIKTFDEIKEVSKDYNNIIPCFGIHPQNAYHYSNNLSDLDDYIKDAKIVGEIGFDSFWSDLDTRKFQRKVFLYQLKLAMQYKKPVSIHTTGAELEVYEILKDYNCKSMCIHWYHGNLEILKKFISLGCYISIGPDIGISKNADEIAKNIPINRILCETDGPDAIAWVQKTQILDRHLSPNYIINVYNNLAKVLKIEKHRLYKIIGQNVLNFIGENEE